MKGKRANELRYFFFIATRAYTSKTKWECCTAYHNGIPIARRTVPFESTHDRIKTKSFQSYLKKKNTRTQFVDSFPQLTSYHYCIVASKKNEFEDFFINDFGWGEKTGKLDVWM